TYTCTSEQENLLLGKWQATQLIEEGDSVKMDLAEVGFLFDEQGRYQFQSTLNYREAGFYTKNNNLLYTTDTLTENRNRQAVKILKLKEGLLELGMVDRGKERVLSLKKETASEE
ncbi:MAG: hypothetical protein AAF599_03135, partial [Bacteroidota bacterium]